MVDDILHLLFLVDSVSYDLTGGTLEREIHYCGDADSIQLTIALYPKQVRCFFPIGEQYNIETLQFIIGKMIQDLHK